MEDLTADDQISSSGSESVNSATNKVCTNKWESYISKEGELFYVDCLLPAALLDIKEIRSSTKISRHVPTSSKITDSEIKQANVVNNIVKERKIITDFHNYAQYYHKFFKILKDQSKALSLIILSIASENQLSEDIVFSYPEKELNDILTAKGSFLTLQSIIKNDFKTELLLSSLKLGNSVYHIYYKNVENILLIFSVSTNNFGINQLLSLVKDFFEYLTFFHLEKITKHGENQKKLEDICVILNINLQISESAVNPFLNLTNYLKLPKDTEAKIYDALNEMEAMDYRDWNEEPLISHREFFICGSLLYFKSYLITSQLPISQANRIKHILNFTGILKVIERNFVEELILWYEVPIVHTNQKSFLAVCSRNNLTIACLLQTTYPANITQEQPLKIIYPSLFYIEEIQDTLDYLNEKGIKNIAQNVFDYKQQSNEISKFNKTSSKLENIRKTFDDMKLPIFSASGHSNNSQTHSEESMVIRDDEHSELDSEWDGFPISFKSTSEIDKYSEYKKGIKSSSELSILVDGMFSRKGCYISNIIQINYGMGLIISHVEKLEQILLEKFKSCCEIIHDVLQGKRQINDNTIISDSNDVSNQRKCLNYVKEHGLHLAVNDYMGNPVTFWVIGRLLDTPCGELYVCHYEDIPQNLIEIAFRLLMQSGY